MRSTAHLHRNLKSLLHLLFALAMLTSTAVASPPNILVIMTDEHHAGVMGCAGNPLARTPHLDALAARGILFQTHYCASPICTPSRQSFTTGKYVSGHRVWSNTVGVAEGTPSLARILNAAGYQSYLSGKMHYKGGMSHGYHVISEKTGKITPPKNETDFPKSDMKQKPRRRLPAGQFQDYGSKLGEEFEHAGEANPLDTFVDVARAKNAQAFLLERKPTDKPFFLTVGFIAPHYPLDAPEACLAHFRDRVPAPEIPVGYLATLPLNYRHLRNDRKLESIPPEIVKSAREGYYARVEWIDQQIGDVLESLKKSPFADNTVVIYTSDHGENLGEHGLWWKNSLYDCGARVPLIVSWPKRWKGGQQRTQACGMVDLVQTIAELGGATVPQDWKGKSLLPWLDQEQYPWRDIAVSEYFAGYVASGFVMIRQGDWKYVYHTRADETHGPERELYNLREDPHELKNLAGDAAHRARIKALHEALVAETGEDPEQTEANWRAGLGPSAPVAPAALESSQNSDRKRRLQARDVYDYRNPILFSDNFASRSLSKWKQSVDDQYDLQEVDSKRMKVVTVSGAEEDHSAACFSIERAPNVFRAELGLPHEEGFQERWYAARIQISSDWIIDQTRGDDIVLQWHAIPGNWRPTYPNLAISILKDQWVVSQSFGTAQNHPTRSRVTLDNQVKPGQWVSWVVHAKWSPRKDGLIQIWQDGDLAFEHQGPNVYGTIGVDYTPYFKTGIYHPEWHLDSDAKRVAFEREQPTAKKKVIFVTDLKIGDARSKLADFLPSKSDR